MPANRQTQWAAQFAVASELCKRGYEVSFTLGNNTPLADFMVISPDESMFLVDVKGLVAKNYWRILRKPVRRDLFYILTLVPNGAQNQFFIMTQEAVNAGIEDEFLRLRPEQKALGEKAYRLLGLRWLDAEPFVHRCDILPP